MTAAEHDDEAIKAHYSWAQLHRRDRFTSAQWYRNGNDRCPGSTPDPNPDHLEDCDEYPFASSHEGYPHPPTPSIKLVNRTHNRREGARLAWFYSSNPIPKPGRSGRPRATRFAGCGGPKFVNNPAPATVNGPFPAPAPLSDYFVVPLPAGIDTLGICATP